MIVVGLDPDSKAHGVAVFENGQLTELHNLDLPQPSPVDRRDEN